MQAWLLNIARGFVPVVMESAGAKDVGLRVASPTEEGLDRGVMLLAAPFTVTWRV